MEGKGNYHPLHAIFEFEAEMSDSCGVLSAAFTADHRGFYLSGNPFFPLIQDSAVQQDGSNTVLIRLPAGLCDDLIWLKERQMADLAVSNGKYILWEIDLGLDSFQFLPEDSASFYSFSLVLEEFSKKLWPAFQNHTFGVALYRGTAEFAARFPLSYWEAAFLEWSSGNLPEFEPDYELYSAQVFSEYLHRLISFLPESVQPFAFIDVREVQSPARASQLFSVDRFEYLHLALKGSKAPFSGICWEEGHLAQGWIGSFPGATQGTSQPLVGVCLPKDAYIDSALIQKMDILISDLKDKAEPFCIVSEEKLTEQWDGLDRLIVFSSALSAQGERKLLGFEAAGGIVSRIA